MRRMMDVARPLDCDEVVRALWDYLDGRLRAECLTGIDEHLSRCEECRAHAEFEARLVQALTELRGRHSDPVRLRGDVMRLLREAGMGEEEEGVPRR